MIEAATHFSLESISSRLRLRPDLQRSRAPLHLLDTASLPLPPRARRRLTSWTEPRLVRNHVKARTLEGPSAQQECKAVSYRALFAGLNCPVVSISGRFSASFLAFPFSSCAAAGRRGEGRDVGADGTFSQAPMGSVHPFSPFLKLSCRVRRQGRDSGPTLSVLLLITILGQYFIRK